MAEPRRARGRSIASSRTMAGTMSFTHCSMRVPGEDRKFLMKQHELLRMISQEAVRFFGSLGYHPYEGITEDFDERERLIAHLGDNRAMIMHNHGVLTVGKTAREAFILMKHLLEAAEIQLSMEATSGELIEIPPEVCKKTAMQYEKHDSGRRAPDRPAYLLPPTLPDPTLRT